MLRILRSGDFLNYPGLSSLQSYVPLKRKAEGDSHTKREGGVIAEAEIGERDGMEAKKAGSHQEQKAQAQLLSRVS